MTRLLPLLAVLSHVYDAGAHLTVEIDNGVVGTCLCSFALTSYALSWYGTLVEVVRRVLTALEYTKKSTRAAAILLRESCFAGEDLLPSTLNGFRV